jgi:aryl sulfotransferase
MQHLSTFWAEREQPNVVLVHYDDLLSNLNAAMRGIADRLGVSIDHDCLTGLVAAAGFDKMRQRAGAVAPDATAGILKSNRAFFHTGASGQWRELLDHQGQRRYIERVTQLASLDLIEWAHSAPISGLSAP